MRNENIYKLLLLNVVLNTSALNDLGQLGYKNRGTDTMFSVVSPKDLYSRLVSDIDFKSLSNEEKSNFLFLKKGMENAVDKDSLHDFEMQALATEAHNRTSSSLGAARTNFIFCNFGQNNNMPVGQWVAHTPANGNIYVNLDADYSGFRPSLLMENINSSTMVGSVYENIFKAMNNPSSLTDRDLFLALTTAVSKYVYQDLQENDIAAYVQQMTTDFSTPVKLEA